MSMQLTVSNKGKEGFGLCVTVGSLMCRVMDSGLGKQFYQKQSVVCAWKIGF